MTHHLDSRSLRSELQTHPKANPKAESESASGSGSGVGVGEVNTCGDEVGGDCTVRTLRPEQALASSGANDTAKAYAPSGGASCTCAIDAYPRGCFDCLNIMLLGQDCALTSDSRCVDISKYDWTKDFRHSIAGLENETGDPDAMLYFPAVNTTYCDYTDRTCSVCRDAWSSPQLNPELAALPFCRGEGGCVCVRDCWLDSPTAAAVEYCAGTQGMSWALMDGWSNWGMLAMFLIMLVGVAWLYSKTRRNAIARELQRRSAAATTAGLTVEPSVGDGGAPRRASTAPHLELKGWQSMRESLIRAEREARGGDEHGEQSASTSTTTQAQTQA